VVSFCARLPHAPRGERTRRLIAALEPDWEVRLVEGPPSRAWPALTARLRGSVLIDPYEFESWRAFRRWEPSGDLALLIGWPFSPLFAARRRLAARGIPYVVDVGDPFALTEGGNRPVRGAARWRAARHEERLWRGAAGGILTTPAQAAALREHLAGVPMLIRPNGYEAVPAPPRPPVARDGGHELKLVYFGHYQAGLHVDCRGFFERLLEDGPWRSIAVDQYGSEVAALTPAIPDGVRFRRLDHPASWGEAVRVAAGYDLAFVLGVRGGRQLPSKVVHSLSLPIRRLAFVESADGDAICTYLEGRTGWLILDPVDPRPAERVAEHAANAPAAGELDPPPEESWPRVTDAVAAFLAARLEASAPVSR
jgi:hypothetical protein